MQKINLPLLWRKVPISDSTVSQVFPHKHIDASDHVSHHTITQDNNLLEASQDLTDLFRREPAHVAASRHVRSIEPDTAAAGHCIDEGLAICAERCKRGVEVERRDVACIAVFVGGEGVDRV